MTPATKTLDRMVCVHLDISTWSGRKKLRPEDLRGVTDGAIPPEDLASLGSKRIIDPKALAVFHRIWRRAETLLSSVGVRFLGGYAIPDSELNRVLGEIEKLKAWFENERKQLLVDYDDLIEQWIARHPDWEAIIRKAVTPSGQVSNRIQFRYQAFRVSTAGPDGTEDAGLAEEAEGLSGRLFREVATMANKTWRESYEGRSEVTQRALNPLRTILKKLRSLEFINPKIAPVADQVENTIDGMPKNGKISGADLSNLVGLFHLISDAERMERHGEGLTSGKPSEEEAPASEVEADEPTDVDEPVTLEPALPVQREEPVEEAVAWF